MKKYALLLICFLSFNVNLCAEQVSRPADVWDKPDGKILLSLANDTAVNCIALIDDWYIVSVEFFIMKADLISQDKINKKTTIYNFKNSRIGETKDIVEIDAMKGLRKEKERYSATIVGYLNKKNMKQAVNKILLIEEHMLSEKSILELPRKNSCADLADCIPGNILQKRIKWRAAPPTFSTNQLGNKTLGVELVTPSKKQAPGKQTGAPRLTFEIYWGGRPFYSFESMEGTFYREIHQLYAHNSHWIFEFKQKDIKEKQDEVYSGGVLMNGKNMNARYHFQEMFSYVYIAEKPFFFFRSSSRNGGISYSGILLPIDYDGIHHYLCCKDSGFNPRVYKDMVGFFATRNGALYYVEAGVYN